MFSSPLYVQPYACHRNCPERLIMQDEVGDWYLWSGDSYERDRLVGIPESLALWLIDRQEMDILPAPRMWFEQGALPIRHTAVFGD
jgi:hypothetical protein